MCRIFFAWNINNTKPKIIDFLKQTNHKSKFTPGINNPLDSHRSKDGFGFAWIDHKKHWKLYKNTCTYLEDHQIENKINHMPKQLILGHLRKKLVGAISIANTQPFVYGDFVMMHNGSIDRFGTNKTYFEQFIDAEYIPYINGDSDSIYMFFAFITAYKYSKNAETSVRYVFDWMAATNMMWTSNIVFGSRDNIYICRYKHGSKYPQCLSLYLNYEDHDEMDKSFINSSTIINTNSLLITSEPITQFYKIIPENSGFLCNI